MLPFILTYNAQKCLKLTKMLMTSSCCKHAGAIFYNLGIKNQARKLKFGMRDVIIELSNICSVFFENFEKNIYDSNSFFPNFRGEIHI